MELLRFALPFVFEKRKRYVYVAHLNGKLAGGKRARPCKKILTQCLLQSFTYKTA